MRAIDYFDKGAEAHPDRIAILDRGAQYSYRNAQASSERISRAMRAAGLRDEDRAAIYSTNDGRVLLCMLGLMRAGAAWVPLNYRNAAAANIEYLNYVAASWLFYQSDFRDDVTALRKSVPTLRNLVCIDAARGGDPVKPVSLCVAPLSHAAGVVAFAMFSLGATNVVMLGFEPLEVLRAIEQHRVTHLFLPPTALYKLLSVPDIAKFDYSSLRVFLLAGSPVSPDKLKKAVEIFGPCMCQSYGQTEAPMLLTWLDQKTVAAAAGGEHPERLASCGRATSAVRLEIMDDDGRILPSNQTGEIVARGTLVTPGYYDLPEATAEIRKFGWHHTGDVGYRDDDGFFYIADRKKDMIITGGFNVFSAEVEAGIMALPEVHECAVIGVPDETWGEAVKALVVLEKDCWLDEQTIIKYCKVNLGGMKSPKSVEFRSEIPKTPAGKPDRKTLRAPYWKGTDRAVH